VSTDGGLVGNRINCTPVNTASTLDYSSLLHILMTTVIVIIVISLARKRLQVSLNRTHAPASATPTASPPYAGHMSSASWLHTRHQIQIFHDKNNAVLWDVMQRGVTSQKTAIIHQRTMMMDAICSSETAALLQEPHGVISQKTFFIVTAVKTSNLT
jgi:hypothetical protein